MKHLKRLNWMLTFLPIIVSVILLPLLPETIPAHYNLAGEVDRWGSRLEILIMPLVMLFVGILFPKQMCKVQNTPQKVVYISSICMLMCFGGIFISSIVSAFFSVDSFTDPSVNILQITWILIGLSMIGLGNIMPKVKRNAAFGLRTKWSMANDTCWNLSQRGGGLIMIITGVFLIISCLLVHNPTYQTILMIIIFLFNILACCIYSYQVYKKHGKKSS